MPERKVREVWVTKDGQEFLSESEAHKHEVYSDLLNDLENSDIPWRYSVNPEQVATFLLNQYPALRLMWHPTAEAQTQTTEHWKRIPDSNVRHIWRGENGETAVVDPTFYEESGTPIDSEGDDMQYIETQIKVTP